MLFRSIHAGDLIIAVGNQEIHFSNSKNPAEIQRETVKLTNLPSFQLVMITVFREGSAREAGVKEPDQVLQIPVILGKTPPNLADLGSGKTIQDAAPPPAP